MPFPAQPSTAPRNRASALPGLALCVLVALLARSVHQALPAGAADRIGEAVLAVGFGLLLGNAVGLPAMVVPGVRFSFHVVLRAAIVLLGAAFSVQQVAAIGGRAVAMILVLMAAAIAAAFFLGRLARVPPRLAALIGIGTAVCGNSAIAAAAPVIGARDEEVSFAIATNTLFGTLAVFFYPLIGHALHLTSPAFGTWAGAAVNDTSQVVAAGFGYSDAAGRVATAVKLTRNALLGPAIVAMGFLHPREAAPREDRRPREDRPREDRPRRDSVWVRLAQSFPVFVLGFLAMAALHSIGALHALSQAVGRDLIRDAQWCARVLILIALSGVGLSTRFRAMRQTGLRPFWVGLAAASIVSVIALLWIQWLGPAGAPG